MAVADVSTPLREILADYLTRIYNVSSRKDKALRRSCANILEELKNVNTPPPSSADPFFLPFKIACESRNSKLMEVSLDCIQKLIAGRYLCGKLMLKAPQANGSTPKKSERERIKLIDVIVKTICECSTHPSDNVHLQVIKALLTTVTSSTCEVHEQSLMLAVRACYHIYLSSRNLDNQTSAKATLTQMLNVVFQRMENTTSQLEVIEKKMREKQKELEQRGNVEQKHQIEPDDSDDSESGAESSSEICKEIIGDLVNFIVDTCEAGKPSPHPKGKFGWCVVCKKTANHFCLQTKDSVCGIDCKVTNLNGVIARDLERNPDSSVRVKMALASQAAMLQNDAFLLFRALCKLSMKPLPQGSASQDQPVAMKSKVLSLELLLSILEGSGHTFRSSKRFVEAIREYLVGCLLKNSISPIESIFGLSLSIFLTLIRHFKSHLKNEIGVFLHSIFLKICESTNSTFAQKMMVLKVFSKLSADPQTVVDIFLNYDCGANSINIFTHIITILEKITQTKYVAEDWITYPQEQALKLLALETLVIIMGSMLGWAQPDKRDSDIDDKETLNILDSPSSGEYDDEKEDKRAMELLKAGFSERYEKRKLLKQNMEAGILKFNLKPKHGIAYLTSSNLIQNSVPAIVDFINNTGSLSKTMIGEYLGEQANRNILYAYVETVDFRGLDFDEGIRSFLAGFRIPGEAQMIDRIMEKFAQTYCEQNPHRFATADVAYVLAYAVIMLNTDAHNPMVKNKMTREQFIKSNRGLNPEHQLDDSFLGGIYDRIVRNEIKMNDKEENEDDYIHPRRRFTRFQQESQRMVSSVHDYMKSFKQRQERDGSGSDKFYYATQDDVEAIRPMFEICWLAAVATFSVLLEESEDPRVIHLCLNGYRHGIRIASMFNFETEGEAFVNSLANFTFLGSVNEMKQKNIEAIKMLLQIAHKEGNHLRKAWSRVLSCISDLELLQLMGTNSRTDSEHFGSTSHFDDHSSRSPRRGRNTSRSYNRPPASVDQNGAKDSKNQQSQKVSHQIDISLIDRIFSQSAHLNADAIVHFVKYLCEVSASELSDLKGARIFSLQKIVEITYYNMGRIRLVWSKIWAHLSKHFSMSGCHTNSNISMYAIDSLRQLAVKFLEKDELAHYQFQTQFLQPFEHIMAKNESWQIRELIVQCLSRIIKARVNNVKSGWKSVFAVFSIAAEDSNESVVNSTFDIVEQILEDYFPLIDTTAQSLGMGTLDELVKCLVAFGCNSYTDISLQAIDYLFRCAQHLVDFDKTLKNETSDKAPKHESEISIEDAFEPETPNLKAWFLCLTGLSRMVGDGRLEVRTRALQVLFKILREHGTSFSPHMWQLIFRGVLFPIFDDVRYTKEALEKPYRFRPQNNRNVSAPSQISQHQSQSGSVNANTRPQPSRASSTSLVAIDEEEFGWLETTCHAALSTLVELFAHFYTNVKFILPELLALLNSCIDQEHEDLSKIGIKCWNHLLKNSGHQFDSDTWVTVLQSFDKVFSDTLPHELQSNNEGDEVDRASIQHLAQHFSTSDPPPQPELSSQGDHRSQPHPPSVSNGYGQHSQNGTLDENTPNQSGTSTPNTLPTSPSELEPRSDTPNPNPDEPEPLSPTSDPDTEPSEEPSTPTSAVSQNGVASTTDFSDDDLPPLESVHNSPTVTPVASPSPPATIHMVPHQDEVKHMSRSSSTSSSSRNQDSSVEEKHEIYDVAGRSSRSPSDTKRSSAHSPQSRKSQPRRSASARSLNKPRRAGLPFKPQTVFVKCMVQHLLIDQISEVVSHFYNSLDVNHFEIVLQGLNRSAKFARQFNDDTTRRQELWDAGFMRDRQKTTPELFRQEARAVDISLQILLRLYTNNVLPSLVSGEFGGDAESKEQAPVPPEKIQNFCEFSEQKVLALIKKLFGEFCDNESRGKIEENRSKEVVVLMALKGLSFQFSDAQFFKHLDVLFPFFIKLVHCQSLRIRTLLANVLDTRLGPLVLRRV